jgi:hypothetical protein
VGGAATLVSAGLFTLMATWWSSPLDRVREMPFSNFDTRDIVPIGYALFAFVLGVALGAVIRKTIPAMVATIAAYAAVKGCFFFIRPHFEAPLHAVSKFQMPSVSAVQGINSADWTLSTKVVNAAGKVFSRLSNGFGFMPGRNGTVTFVGAGVCPNKIPSTFGQGGNSGPSKAVQEALAKCVNSFHLTQYVTYQPANRYWPFQWYELACYVVLTALLAGFSIRWIRRH